MRQVIRSKSTLKRLRARGVAPMIAKNTSFITPGITNLLASPKFEDLIDWRMLGSGSIVKKTDTPPAGYSEYVTLTSDDGSFDRLEPRNALTTFVIGVTYRVRALVRKGTGSITDQGWYFFTFTDGAEAETAADTADWQWVEVDVVATSTSGLPRLYVTRSGTAGDTLDCAEIQVYSV